MNHQDIKESLQVANYYFQNGNYSYAEVVLKSIILKDVTNTNANELLAYIYESQGKFELALQSYKIASAGTHVSLDILYGYGSLLLSIGEYQKAKLIFYKALDKFGDCFEVLHDLAVTLSFLGDLKNALINYEKALKFRDNSYELFFNIGRTLDELQQFDKAVYYYQKALNVNPNVDWTYGSLFHVKMKMADWTNFSNAVKVVSEKINSGERVMHPFVLLSLNDDARLHKKCSEIYIKSKYASDPVLGPISKVAGKEKIRLGYFSPDFRAHPVSFLTAELFEIHDRSKFEVIAFSLRSSPPDDEMNSRLRGGFDLFIDVGDLSDMDIAKLAREQEIDIAIDLTGPTEHSRTGIFSYRAAPLQVNWLGYPGTIGADFMDYIVADEIIIPESHQEFYTEKIIRLPHTYMVDDSKRIASTRVFTREECGLPENTFVFCCFNNDYKFNPGILDSWARILLKVDNSILWIPEGNKYFKVNVLSEFKRRGIDSTRIVFSRKEELMSDYLAKYSLADLFLDTFPYNAHTTALDALKVCVPVLTLMGQSFASRVASSLLIAIGMPELIANTQDDYESLAVILGKNSERMRIIKAKLISNRLISPLFNTHLFAKHLELAYLEIYGRYSAGLGADNLNLG